MEARVNLHTATYIIAHKGPFSVPCGVVWLVSRELSNGQGDISLESAYEGIKSVFGDQSLRNWKRWLKAGQGLFWSVSNGRLWLKGQKRLTTDLAQRLKDQGYEFEGNLPYAYDVHIDTGSSKQEFCANVRKALLGYTKVNHKRSKNEPEIIKGNVAVLPDGTVTVMDPDAPDVKPQGKTISAATQAKIFDCSVRTIWNWNTITPVDSEPNIVQTTTAQYDLDQLPPEIKADIEQAKANGTQPKRVRQYTTPDGKTVLRWQTANTYFANTRIHPHKGQSRKLRNAVKIAIGLQPLDHRANEGQSVKQFYSDEHRFEGLKERGRASGHKYVLIGHERRENGTKRILDYRGTKSRQTRVYDRLQRKNFDGQKLHTHKGLNHSVPQEGSVHSESLPEISPQPAQMPIESPQKPDKRPDALAAAIDWLCAGMPDTSESRYHYAVLVNNGFDDWNLPEMFPDVDWFMADNRTPNPHCDVDEPRSTAKPETVTSADNGIMRWIDSLADELGFEITSMTTAEGRMYQ